MRAALFLLAAWGWAMAVLPSASAALTNRYVVKGNINAAAPYDTTANAAGDIQTAIDYAFTVAGETVLVAAATYDAGGKKATGAGLTNRVYISKAITVKSVDNNPATAIIQGAKTPVTIEGASAVRSVYMVAGSSLIGFTVSNGSTYTVTTVSGDDVHGGGIFAVSTASIISNCVIMGNSAYNYGGGIYKGSVFNSRIVSNAAAHGAGTYSSIVSNCLVSYNLCHTRGPDTWNTYGGAGENSSFYNCILSYNLGNSGGAFNTGSARNCLIYGNRGTFCAGALNSTVYNCTIIGNYSTRTDVPGGLYVWYGGTTRAYNCIISSNFGWDVSSLPVLLNWGMSGDAGNVITFTNCCTTPNQVGWDPANITNNPLFMANGSGFGSTFVPGNYHLKVNSPCVNRGVNQAWMTNAVDGVDLDGRPRIRYGTVDMGAYEVIYAGTLYGVR